MRRNRSKSTQQKNSQIFSAASGLDKIPLELHHEHDHPAYYPKKPTPHPQDRELLWILRGYVRGRLEKIRQALHFAVLQAGLAHPGIEPGI
jgi:hypothetical protein